MPRTRWSSSSEPKGPCAIRSVTMRLASAGPIPGTAASSSSVATSTSTGGSSWRRPELRAALFPSASACNRPWARDDASRCSRRESSWARRATYRSRLSKGSSAIAGVARSGRVGRAGRSGRAGGSGRSGRGFPPARVRLPPRAIAESTRPICRANPARAASVALALPSRDCHPRTATPRAATLARKISARFSPGVGIRHNSPGTTNGAHHSSARRSYLSPTTMAYY